MNNGKLISLITEETDPAAKTISDEHICKQLNRILAHSLFKNSPILCKFLSFIVKETMAGNGNQLKEYSIAVQVLNKPISFDTRKDGIVRVHATRLRRALNTYYHLADAEERVIISIPVGSYNPSFLPFRPKTENISKLKSLHSIDNFGKTVLAILPFKTCEKNTARVGFADGLGQKLSFDIKKTIPCSVISYRMIKEYGVNALDENQFAAHLNPTFLLSGDVHFERKNIRVFVQLIEKSTLFQVWSDIYHMTLVKTPYFELADIIISRIIGSLQIFFAVAGSSAVKNRQIKICIPEYFSEKR